MRTDGEDLTSKCFAEESKRSPPNRESGRKRRTLLTMVIGAVNLVMTTNRLAAAVQGPFSQQEMLAKSVNKQGRIRQVRQDRHFVPAEHLGTSWRREMQQEGRKQGCNRRNPQKLTNHPSKRIENNREIDTEAG